MRFPQIGKIQRSKDPYRCGGLRFSHGTPYSIPVDICQLADILLPFALMAAEWVRMGPIRTMQVKGVKKYPRLLSHRKMATIDGGSALQNPSKFSFSSPCFLYARIFPAFSHLSCTFFVFMFRSCKPHLLSLLSN